MSLKRVHSLLWDAIGVEMLFKPKLFELNNNDETVYENDVKNLVQDYPEVFTEQFESIKVNQLILSQKKMLKLSIVNQGLCR